MRAVFPVKRNDPRGSAVTASAIAAGGGTLVLACSFGALIRRSLTCNLLMASTLATAVPPRPRGALSTELLQPSMATARIYGILHGRVPGGWRHGIRRR